jgi:uncharacterized membrane protein YebE (DUF533 family)
MNPFDILGAVMQAGMSPSSGNRMGGVLGQMMGGGAQGGAQGGAPGGGMIDILSKVAGSMMGGGAPGMGGGPGMGGAAGMGGFPTEILKQVAGAVLGGGAPGGNAAAGAGSMAVFGTLAAQALEMAKSMMGGGEPSAGAPQVRMDDRTAVIAGMRAPQTPDEQRQLMDMATLTLKAMITAVKADGQVDEQEKQRLLGKLQEGGISPEEQRFVNEEMSKPIDLDALVRVVPNAQAAAQVYAASLMAIQVDTEAERRYMSDLAARLGLDTNAVAYMHKAVGLA